MKKKTLIIVVAIVVAVVVLLLALPMFIDVNRFRPTLETEMSSALGRKVDIGNIQLAIFSGGVTIDNLSISDDPAFSHSSFLKAKQLTVGVELLPLIFSKRLEVRSFKVVEPEVSLLRSSSGVWNFSTMAASQGKTSKGSDASSTANFSVGSLAISYGRIIVGTAGSKAKPQVYENVNLEASDLSYTTQFPFKLSAKTPGNGAVKLEGKAGPINQADASLTPLDAKIDVEHLDITSTGFVPASSGIAGVVDFNGNASSNGKQASSKGSVKLNKAKFVPAGSPASVPIDVEYSTEYDLNRQAGVLKQGDVHIGKALARLTGSYEMKGETTSVQMKLNGKDMPVPDLEGVLSAVGVALPSGASLKSGTLDAELAINGPTDRLVITGPINLSNGKLTGFNIGSKLGALASFAGLGGKTGSDTEIQTLSANVRVEPGGTHAENLNIVVPSIGSMTGNANISPSGQLDCKMVAKLSSAGNPIGGITSKISPFGGSSQGGIPFRIQGTTSNPIFVPDVVGMVGNVAKNPVGSATAPAGAAAGAIGGLFGKKKKP
ncbi:MAG: AsmA family protein [Candidatus Acidiferrales bacterium]